MKLKLSRQLDRIIPGSHVRELVIGEIFRQELELAHEDGVVYAHSLMSLYAAGQLTRERPLSVHFFPFSPRIFYKNDSAKFVRVGKRNLDKTLKSLRSAKPLIRSLVAIKGGNTGMVRWWNSWGGYQGDRTVRVQNAWAVNTQMLESLLFEKGDPRLTELPAHLVVDCDKMDEAPIARVATALSKVHPYLKLFAIVDTNKEIEKIKDIAAAIPGAQLVLVDRRDYSRKERYRFLLKGLVAPGVRRRVGANGKLTPLSAPDSEETIEDLNPNVKGEEAVDFEAFEPFEPFAPFEPFQEPEVFDPNFDPTKNIEIFDPIESPPANKSRTIIDQIEQFEKNASQYFGEIRPDVLVSFDIISAPTGHSLALRHGAKHIIDFNETPVFEDRVGKVFKSLSPAEMNRLYEVCEIGASSCEIGISPSTLLGQTGTEKFGPKVEPIRSFHGTPEFPEVTGPREEFEISDDKLLLVHCCTYAKEYDSSKLIDVLALLPEKYHLLMVGNANNEEYASEFKSLILKNGLDGRVHFKPSIDGAEKYLAYMAQGDLGLIILDNTIATVRDGLANRFVDLVGAGLPIISTHAYESTLLINQYEIGTAVDSINPSDLSAAIVKFADEKLGTDALGQRLETARTALSWDEEMRRFSELVGTPKNKTVCFVFQRGLRFNKRILRLANGLAEQGWKVYCMSGVRPLDRVIEEFTNITFIRILANRPWRDGEMDTEKNYYTDAAALKAWLAAQEV